jgi:hypothetical protein
LTGSGTATTYEWSNNIQNNEPFSPSNSGYYSVTGIDINGCSNKDSTFIDFFTLMPVSYVESITQINLTDLAFNVTPGNPQGGTYTGPGIIGTSFHPGLAGVGTHPIVYSVLNTNGCYSSDTSYITVIDNVGISEFENDIKIFPNPTSANLWITANQPFEYAVLSNDGKILYKGILLKDLELNLSQLSNGLYFIQLTNESKNYEYKVSKID